MKRFILPVLLLCLVSSGCAANRAVRTAVVGQGAELAGLLQCADVVSKNPAMVPLLNAKLATAQALIDAGNPLLGIFTVGSGQLDPRAVAALTAISAILQKKMDDFMAAAEGAVSGCHKGILSVPVKP